MSERRTIDEEDLLAVLPELNKSYLPAKTSQLESSDQNYQERELLYKLLFDMKADLNELKSLVFGLINENKLSIPDAEKVLTLPERSQLQAWQNPEKKESEYQPFYRKSGDDLPSIIYEEDEDKKNYDEAEPIEESLSLEDMEKEFIRKALRSEERRVGKECRAGGSGEH